MFRWFTYLALTLGGLSFWLMELYFNYRDYAGNSPMSLERDYQKAFVYNRSFLLFSELFFPLAMLIAFLLLLIFKLAERSIRVAMGLILFLSMEFWMWRSFVFDGRMSMYYIQSEAKDPLLQMPHTFKEYMIAFGIGFLVVIFLREFSLQSDPDTLDARLKRSLKKRKL